MVIFFKCGFQISCSTYMIFFSTNYKICIFFVFVSIWNIVISYQKTVILKFVMFNLNNLGFLLPTNQVDWTAELHRKFVQAVEQLGIDKAVPSRILEIMNVKSLTRHNVASHLQVRLHQFIHDYIRKKKN